MNPYTPLRLALLTTLGSAGLWLSAPACAESPAWKLESLSLELGALPDDAGASSMARATAAVSAKGDSGDWSYALGARLDASGQTGAQSMDRVRADYTENYLRWQGESVRVTAGAQNLLWGRVDEISPIDRMSRADLSHAMLDRLPERRRAVPAVRVQHFGQDSQLDMVWLPVFDEAVMPHADSVWHPVDTVNGRILGVGSMPALAGAQIRRADIDGSGGAGLRWTAEGKGFDYGMSLQRARSSQPYYRVLPGAPVVLQAMHPISTVVGSEFETEAAGATWRMELAWSSDNPLTTPALQVHTAPGLAWVAGAEFFPGDSETRVTLQWGGQRIRANEAVLDRTRMSYVTGEVEHPFAQGSWRADLRFSLGLQDRDNYLNPRLTYTGIDQHELSVGLHLFSGEDRTLGGYYRRNDALTMGWKARF